MLVSTPWALVALAVSITLVFCGLYSSHEGTVSSKTYVRIMNHAALPVLGIFLTLLFVLPTLMNNAVRTILP